MVPSIRDSIKVLLAGTGSWLWQNFIALDQLLNTLTFGMADETLSSRAFRADVKGRIFGRIFRPLIDALFFFDKDHCMKSFINEVQRRHLPKHFQEI